MLKILLIIVIVLFCLFLLSLVIYFFNLDMKLAAAMIPIMNKIYDRGKATQEKKAAAKMNGTKTDKNGKGTEAV